MPTIQKSLQILDFVERYKQINRESPTLQEIADQFGFRSLASVHEHLVKMQKRRWITRQRYQHRGIRILNPPQRTAA